MPSASMRMARQESREGAAGRCQPRSWSRSHRAGEHTGALTPILLLLEHLECLSLKIMKSKTPTEVGTHLQRSRDFERGQQQTAELLDMAQLGGHNSQGTLPSGQDPPGLRNPPKSHI